jgi:hypothetical protein
MFVGMRKNLRLFHFWGTIFENATENYGVSCPTQIHPHGNSIVIRTALPLPFGLIGLGQLKGYHFLFKTL